MQVPNLVGCIVTICNDAPLIPKWYESFSASMPERYAYGLLAVDGGSYDGSAEMMTWCEVFGPHPDLSKSLNVGIKAYLTSSTQALIRKYGNVPNLIDPFEYICWIHPDMEFPQKGWLPKLVAYLQAHPEVGKLAPDSDHIQVNQDRDGNQCPWIMPTKVLRQIEMPDGTWFDENFVGIGGMEDWDINKRIVDAGYKVRITHDVIVKHPGMGTRALKDTNRDAVTNRAYYTKKWGTAVCPV